MGKKVGRKLKQGWNKNIKKRLTPNKILRSWKPFKDRGLGLGKLIAGSIKTGTDALPGFIKPKGWDQKLEYIGRKDSITGSGKRAIEGEGWQDTDEFERYEGSDYLKEFQEQYGSSAGMFSNKEIMDILSSGDKEKIRAFYQTMGTDTKDFGSYLDALLESGVTDLRGNLSKNLLNQTEKADAMWSDFATNLASAKRGSTGFGGIDLDSISDLSANISNQMDAERKAEADRLVNQFLQTEDLA